MVSILQRLLQSTRVLCNALVGEESNQYLILIKRRRGCVDQDQKGILDEFESLCGVSSMKRCILVEDALDGRISQRFDLCLWSLVDRKGDRLVVDLVGSVGVQGLRSFNVFRVSLCN